MYFASAALASAERSLGGLELFNEGFLIELENDLALLHLGAFDERRFLHESLDPRAHLDVLRRIELADQRGGERHFRSGDFHHLDDRRRQRGGFGFLAGVTAKPRNSGAQMRNPAWAAGRALDRC